MLRRPVVTLALLGVLAVVLSGCSSSTEQGASTTARETGAGAGQTAPPTSAPEVGETLRAFVEAAGDGDVASMWRQLAPETQERLGPTESDFARRYGTDFERGLGAFAGTDYQIVLSVETESGWGVAAVAGNRVRNGESEFAAYGATLRREGGSWRLVLGEPVAIENLAPPSTTTRERQPAIRVRIRADAPIDEAGVWLDGEALPAEVQGTDRRDIRVQGTPAQALAPGWHVVVVFGRAGDVASAGAKPFRVDAAGGGGAVA